MSCLDYDTQKWTMVSFASVAITLIIGLVLMQYAHGQAANDTAKSMVDKLIKDTYTNTVQEREYRAELIKRMDNTACSDHLIGNVTDQTTSLLEGFLKMCIENGWSLNKTNVSEIK